MVGSVETAIAQHRQAIDELQALDPSTAVTCPNCCGLTSIVRPWEGGPDPCYGVVDYVETQRVQRPCKGTCTVAEAIRFHEFEIEIFKQGLAPQERST